MSRKAITLKSYSSERTPLGDPPAEPKHISKKNTKRWCKGKAGQEHDIQRVPWDEYHWPPNNPQAVERLKEWRKRAAEDRAAGRRGILFGDISDILVCKICKKQLGREVRNDRA